MEQFIQQNLWFVVLLLIWTLPWKGVALWKSARSKDKWWFVIFLVVNTLAILEILYIFVFSKKILRSLGVIKKNLYIKIMEFGDKHQQGFIYQDLKDALELEPWEDKIVQEYMNNAIKNGKGRPHWNGIIGSGGFIEPDIETIFFVIDMMGGINDSKFVIKYDAYFSYINYLELQEMKKSSKWAMRTAVVSIFIGIIGAIVSICFAWRQMSSLITIKQEQLEYLRSN